MEAFCKLGNSSSPCCQDGHDAKAAKRAGNTPPGEEEMSCESSNAREATGNGIKTFCQVGHGESDVGWVEEEELRRALECTLDNGDEGSRELGDEEMQDWVSPRISFSQDFVMEDMNALSQGGVPITVLPDGKKGEREKDNYSAEFEFLKNGAGYCVPDQAKSFMLSADELFFDGKLLPLPFSSIWAENEHMSLPLPDGEHHEETTLSALKSNNRAVSRHLSFDTPTPSSSSSSSSSVLSSRAVLESCSCPASPSRSSHVDQIPSISMPPLPSSSSQTSRTWPPKLPPSSQPPAAPLSSLLPSSSCSMSSSLSPSSSSLLSSSSTSLSLSSSSSLSKCSSKLKDLFRSKRSSIGTYPPSGDNSISSIRRPLIITRSFWPFSRSKSAGESKTTAPPPLPCRSNSAGETHSYTNVSISKECGESEDARLSTCLSVGDPEKQGPIAMMCQDDVHLAQAVGMLDVVRVEENRDCSTIEQSAKKTISRADRTALKGSLAIIGSSSNMNGKKISGASVNVSKSSPGRRKGTSDGYGAKTHGGKIVLKNLERCSAEKKVGNRDGGPKGINRRGAYPVGARVSPLLNVAVYRGGNTSKMGLFGFGASKKEKKADEAALNWRNGA